MTHTRQRRRAGQPLKLLVLLVAVALTGSGTATCAHSMPVPNQLPTEDTRGASRHLPSGADAVPADGTKDSEEATGTAQKPRITQKHGVIDAAPVEKVDGQTDTAALAKRFTAIKSKPGHTAAAVVDPASGKELYGAGDDTLLMPASNLKVVTMASMLSVRDAGTRFTTTVVSPASGKIVLVGGGDPYLKRSPGEDGGPWASTEQLARRTAAALRKAGTTSVTLSYDDSLFGGTTWHPSWPKDYADQVTTITSLWVDEGVDPATGVRVGNPADQAATTFADQLKANGIKVTGKPARTKGSGAKIAEVRSAPLEEIINRALLHSDNSATEVMGRQLALTTGGKPDPAGVRAALQAKLKEFGAWQDGAVIDDASGLSRSNRVSPRMLATVWTKVLATPAMQPMLDGVPISGVTGGLSYRYDQPETKPARGLVHAKTGTLTGVASLSGWVRTPDGRVLVEGLIVNDAPVDQGQVWADHASAAVSHG